MGCHVERERERERKRETTSSTSARAPQEVNQWMHLNRDWRGHTTTRRSSRTNTTPTPLATKDGAGVGVSEGRKCRWPGCVWHMRRCAERGIKGGLLFVLSLSFARRDTHAHRTRLFARALSHTHSQGVRVNPRVLEPQCPCWGRVSFNATF